MLSVSYIIKSRPVDSYQYYHMFHTIHCRRYIHSHAGETVVLPCADAPAPFPACLFDCTRDRATSLPFQRFEGIAPPSLPPF